MILYKSEECKDCKVKKLCTRNKNGRIIYRWENEEVLEEMRERVKREKGKVKLRNLLTEHIFGTMKRNFNQGYMLLRGKEKVSVEISLTVLAYNITRVLNIVGLDGLINAVKEVHQLKNRAICFFKKYFVFYFRVWKEKNKKLLDFHPIYRFYYLFSHNLSSGSVYHTEDASHIF